MSKLKSSAELLQGKTKGGTGAAAKGGAAKAKAPRKQAATKPRKAARPVVDDSEEEGEADNAQHDDVHFSPLLRLCGGAVGQTWRPLAVVQLFAFTTPGATVRVSRLRLPFVTQ